MTIYIFYFPQINLWAIKIQPLIALIAQRFIAGKQIEPNIFLPPFTKCQRRSFCFPQCFQYFFRGDRQGIDFDTDSIRYRIGNGGGSGD